MKALTVSAMAPIFDELLEERRRQDAKWGEQNHPSLPPLEVPFSGNAVCKVLFLPTVKGAKMNVAIDVEAGTLSWAVIATEELCEAVSCADDATRRGELVQLAAVVVAWIQAIDRREGAPK